MTDVDARPQQASRQDTGEYAYQRGFGNEFASEAVAGALPAGRNSPQRAPLGLFAEQLSGTAFTQPRAVNRRTWVYRIMPSAAHPRFARIGNGTLRATPFDAIEPDPNRLRWTARPVPDRGPIGANGLANERDFLAPSAAYQDRAGTVQVVQKFGGNLWAADYDHSPLDVVGWHGNYAPYKYDTANFMVIGSISFDHPDPSIFTVLTSPSELPGLANADFVIFPPRWLVGEDTFRPPWYHRNIMSEFMGLVRGVYDAKAEGFEPGGASLHNTFASHGPDAETYQRASTAELRPQKIDDTLAFMFESRWMLVPTRQAMEAAHRQPDYDAVWGGLTPSFRG